MEGRFQAWVVSDLAEFVRLDVEAAEGFLRDGGPPMIPPSRNFIRGAAVAK